MEDRIDVKDALAALAETETEGTIPLDDLLKEFGVKSRRLGHHT